MARPYYRRRTDSDTWHFCRNCTLDPKSDYVSYTGPPTPSELCNQCRGKERDSNCT